MQFTPNIKERYAASLRNLIMRRATKGKKTEKNLRLLKIITVFSALIRSSYKENVNLYENIEKLLKTVRFKFYEQEKLLSFSLKGQRIYKIDFYLLKLLILELISAPTQKNVELKIFLLEESLIITVKNARATKILKCLVKKLKGILINIRGESNLAVKISAPCVLDFENLAKDNEIYEDLFSSVNIMLFR